MEIVLSLHSMQQTRYSHRQRREQYWVQGTYDERQGCRPRPDFVFAKRTSYTTPSVQHKPTKNKDSSCCVPVPRTDSSTYQHYSSCNMNTHSWGSRLGTLRNFEVYFEKKMVFRGEHHRNATCIWYVEVWELKLYFYPSARGLKKKKKKKKEIAIGAEADIRATNMLENGLLLHWPRTATYRTCLWLLFGVAATPF